MRRIHQQLSSLSVLYIRAGLCRRTSAFR
jgi:hypothetical protein